VARDAPGLYLACCPNYGGELTPLILDVTDPSNIAAAAGIITGYTGPAGLDGLVNNAGFGLACPTELVQLSAFRRQLEVNVTGQHHKSADCHPPPQCVPDRQGLPAAGHPQQAAH
jgi:NAD(P)-dependent dehydrogenase (short-subunit alcohol dehydrogenase family)